MTDFVIAPEYDGKTVKTFVSKLNISRSELIRLKSRENGILLNGVHATVRAVLKTGDVLSLQREDFEENSNENIVPSDIPVDIIYEDNDVLAVNKPQGMPTHPSHGHFTDTLANALAFEFLKRGTPFVFRAVNRLDRDTGGIVLVAKNKGAAFAFSKLMTEGKIEKEYLALAEGVVNEPFSVDKNIKRRQESIIERVVCPENEGQTALTRFYPLGNIGGNTLLRCVPITGRTHQIRVHLASVGHPIIGDGLYGKESTEYPFQQLFCTKLTLHAAEGDIVITAPSPYGKIGGNEEQPR